MERAAIGLVTITQVRFGALFALPWVMYTVLARVSTRSSGRVACFFPGQEVLMNSLGMWESRFRRLGPSRVIDLAT
jgi:hypothetical protein